MAGFVPQQEQCKGPECITPTELCVWQSHLFSCCTHELSMSPTTQQMQHIPQLLKHVALQDCPGLSCAAGKRRAMISKPHRINYAESAVNATRAALHRQGRVRMLSSMGVRASDQPGPHHGSARGAAMGEAAAAPLLDLRPLSAAARASAQPRGEGARNRQGSVEIHILAGEPMPQARGWPMRSPQWLEYLR